MEDLSHKWKIWVRQWIESVAKGDDPGVAPSQYIDFIVGKAYNKLNIVQRNELALDIFKFSIMTYRLHAKKQALSLCIFLSSKRRIDGTILNHGDIMQDADLFRPARLAISKRELSKCAFREEGTVVCHYPIGLYDDESTGGYVEIYYEERHPIACPISDLDDCECWIMFKHYPKSLVK